MGVFEVFRGGALKATVATFAPAGATGTNIVLAANLASFRRLAFAGLFRDPLKVDTQ